MSTRLLKWSTIILPVAFWILILDLQERLRGQWSHTQVELLTAAIVFLGALVFSTWVFRVVEHREAEIQHRTEQLEALHQAALTLTTELELGVVLQKVVDLARKLIGARYGALGVLDESGRRISQFVTSGLSEEEHMRIGAPPEGKGLLGVIIQSGMPLRVDDISTHPLAVGFPEGHPAMHSLLGVPIAYKGRVVGNLYLTDKILPYDETQSVQPFTEEDQRLLEMFATQAAIAIENAQLYRKTQQLAILQERERFGMDLHDGVIQSIYAVGLQLEAAQQVLPHTPQQAHEVIQQAIHGLNDVIRDIRNYILDLRPARFQGRDLHRGLKELVRDLRANSFLEISLDLDGVSSDVLTPEQTVEVLHIVQEALTNVRKHARARNVAVSVWLEDGEFHLEVADDGIGLQPNPLRSGGHGLLNMRQRASHLGGTLDVAPARPRGTRVRLQVPLNPG